MVYLRYLNEENLHGSGNMGNKNLYKILVVNPPFEERSS
jgi:hypothetical protein